MIKSSTRKLTFFLIFLLAIPVSRAFAADATPAPALPPAPIAAPSPAPNGITGTDPEPIEPDIVGLILSILKLA